MDDKLIFIGEIHTPYKSLEECPHNIDENGPLCSVEVYPEYIKGMVGLQPESNILILYWLNFARRSVDIGYSYMKSNHELCGTFAKRSPHRPNPIGVAKMKIIKIEENKIYVRGLDCLDGTSLLDIKPAILKE